MNTSFDARLQKVYGDIHACHVCPAMDPHKALRLTQAVNPDSDVFIVSQALAEKQARCTGVPFFQFDTREPGPGVELPRTGTTFEAFLNKFGRTLYPPQDIALSANVTIPECRPDLLSVYSTDIVSCYPGKRTYSEDRRQPSSDEIRACLRQGFLLRQVQLMKPKLILLMGMKSRDAFFRHVLDEHYPRTLSSHIRYVLSRGQIPQYHLSGIAVRILPIDHPSSQNHVPFHQMAGDPQLLDLIRQALQPD